MVSAKASCCDITCESIPDSPPPFLFHVYFSSGRGESLGTEAKLMQNSSEENWSILLSSMEKKSNCL